MAAQSKIQTPSPTDARRAVDSELGRWRRIFAGEEYYYGSDPGPVARRAVRYHRPHLASGGTAIDIGCGEGQDLVFLAQQGYHATGLEFTPEGAAKSRLMLERGELAGEVVEASFLDWKPPHTYDLVIAVNALQFMGEDAAAALEKTQAAVAPGGVIGLSLFACETGETQVSGTIFFISLDELLRRFQGWQPLEAAQLWQWNAQTGRPQAFITLIARRVPPSDSIELR